MPLIGSETSGFRPFVLNAIRLGRDTKDKKKKENPLRRKPFTGGEPLTNPETTEIS